MEIDISFGDWLKKRRKALDLTREELAQRVGYSTSALRKIESDERRPSKQLIELLANILEIPTEEYETFLQIARGNLSIERMKSPHLPNINLLQSPHASSTHIPIPPTTLIGRETELSALCQMLADPQCRLLTITGMGGIGKTRLAIETVSLLKENFADGVSFVPLASLTSPDFLVSAIADALNINLTGSQDSQKQLFNALSGKKLLLVLDNAETLLQEAGLFAEMLTNAPSLKLLVTSREQLNIQWEWVFEIQGLSVPINNHDEHVELSSSVALFMQRAQQVKADLQFGAEELAWAARICQMVEGNPLAIELAAPWVRVLSIQEIAEELEKHLDILESSTRDMPCRHRSIRTTLNYSWDLLSDDEKRTLAQISTFRGSFTREATEQIASATMLLLSLLRTKSWLQRSANGRYILHELVRQYAAEKLQMDSEEERRTRLHFSDHYAINMEKWEDKIKSPNSVEALAEMRDEIDNMRQAWDWMIQFKQSANVSRSYFSLYWFYELHGLYKQGITLFDNAINMLRAIIENDIGQKKADEDLKALGRVLSLEARWLARSGDLETASKNLEESIPILQSTQDKAIHGDALRLSGNIELIKGNYERAEEILQESVALCRGVSHQWGLTSSLIVLGNLLQFQGEYERSLQVSTEAVTVARAVGEPRMLASSLFYLADVTQSLGLFDDAEELLKESLAISESIQDRWSVACALQILGTIAQKKNEFGDAVEHLRSSLAIFQEMGDNTRIVSSMIELGSALQAQGSFKNAKSYFIKTIEMAAVDQLFPAVMEALIGIATILMREKEIEAAYRLATFALQHPATYPLIKEHAERLCSDLEGQFTPEQIESIQATVKNSTLEEVVGEVKRFA